jgi:hypothetical protein
MRVHTKLLLAAFAASSLLAFAVAAASAREFTTDETRFLAQWTALTLRARVLGGEVVIRCPVSLEGSFHSATIRKVAESLIGYVTQAIAKVESCTGGRAQPRQTSLPWHIRYESFEGVLPNINKINLRLVGAGFTILEPVRCEYTTSATNPARGELALGADHRTVTELTANSTARIPSSTIGCPEGVFEGRGSVGRQSDYGAIHVSLI